MTGRFLRGVTAAAVPLVVLTGCTNDDPEVPVVPTPSATDGTETPQGEATPSVTSTIGVPELCEEVATAGEVASILQVPMDGETQRIYNDEFMEDSGRTGRLTCRYGVPIPAEGQTPPPTPAPPPVEVSISGYVDAETAAGRIDSTVDAARAGGSQVQDQSVGDLEGFLLNDAEDISFVAADDVRTYVVTLRHGLVPTAAEPVVLLDLARHLLGVPTSTPTS